jgi:hypothetical protein
MALERISVVLHGYSGELIDAGSNALYWEASFSGSLLEDFLAASKQRTWVNLVNGDLETSVVILHCWYNMETRRVLVQFLSEHPLVEKDVAMLVAT